MTSNQVCLTQKPQGMISHADPKCWQVLLANLSESARSFCMLCLATKALNVLASASLSFAIRTHGAIHPHLPSESYFGKSIK